MVTDNKKVRDKSSVTGYPLRAFKVLAGTKSGAAGQPRGSSGEASGRISTSPSNRTRLLFPNYLKLNFNEELLWTLRLGRAYRSFEPLLKKGRNKPHVTVGS